ncbi:unnamed protein product [Periconia digitata]|uniref:Protein kinase domain-containing protein n=1 Tax=Periconia digitata TaxID=1303443 RepID=A0A9W4UW26_9PLEO|nr:unnamed protein product [Periconia digitata]
MSINVLPVRPRILCLIGARSASRWKRISGVSILRHSFSTTTYQMDQLSYYCGIDAEPLHRYGEGGYHPTLLGDVLKDGRYRILHKLGWGGYSTVWAARDLREHKYVALKISAAEKRQQSQEVDVMRTLAAATRTDQPGSHHLMSMLDNFQLEGPNGSHDCFVLEMLGPSVSDLVETRMSDERLPGKLAKTIAKQALLGLDYLHQQKIGHGDLHIRNLAFTIPSVDSLNEEQFCKKLGKPETGMVRRKDGKPLDPGVPQYLVRPFSYPADSSLFSSPIKIIDFGEAFLSNDTPRTLHTPLPIRAPEIIFGEKLDYRVDMWSMGCLLFELVVGQPPFDSIMTTPTVLVRQMLEMCSDDLPERWQQSWRAIDNKAAGENSNYTLQQWLEEMYFDGERNEDLTRDDIIKVGELVGGMLRFEPSTRTSAREVLQDPWFNGE